ncbi:hypothetical protein E2C01_001825 [Portunus trituberculatus]|uniref:Uncharacterized protein n=1 Tax=Portunus trituberculatus TaxID=210409 RepID=A0A5B7CNI3_PORTR|nr:hypothetical protein [Portunus trituberculatus]
MQRSSKYDESVYKLNVHSTGIIHQLPAVCEQRVAQTKWLKGTLTLRSDKFRERSDVTGELRGLLCAHQGAAKFEFKSASVHSVVRGHPTAKSEFHQAEIRQVSLTGRSAVAKTKFPRPNRNNNNNNNKSSLERTTLPWRAVFFPSTCCSQGVRELGSEVLCPPRPVCCLT